MKVAVIGLGQMGVEIARRIEDSDHELIVHNRTASKTSEFAERGATVAATPAEAFAAADLGITMLIDGPAVHDVVLGPDGVLAGDAINGKTLIDMSTIDVGDSVRVAQSADEAGVAYLRAPVSGNPGVVAAGNLTILVSGEEEHHQAAEEVLLAVGPTLHYLGEGEAARAMKLALNLMIAGTTELMAEALVMGEAHGLERSAMLKVMGESVMGSPFVKYKTQPLIDEDFSSTFTTSGLAKDLDLICATASEKGVPVPVAALVRELIQSCIDQGMGDLDFAALVPRLEKEAGRRDDLPTA
jgi:3-hydroxyisobutyrate dehydrogenase-like beta-hydroxyacid dehydrogenase